MKNRANRYLALAVMAGFAAVALPAHAELITFRIDGTLTRVTDPNGVIPLAAAVGDAYSLFYTFESTTPGTRGGTTPPWILRYDAITELRVRLNGVDVALPTRFGEMTLENDNCQPFAGCTDSYGFVASNSVIDPLFLQAQLGMSSNTPAAGAALASLALPTEPLDAASFAARSVQLYFLDPFANHDGTLLGTVDSINPVPLPGAALLFGSALILARLRRKPVTPAASVVMSSS